MESDRVKLKLTIDYLTLGFVMLAFSLILYFKTYVGIAVSVDLPESLLLVGFTIYVVMGFTLKRDETTSQKELNNLFFYTGVAVAAFIVASASIPELFNPSLSLTELSITDQFLYGQLYAVSEEVFFRGAFTAFIFYPLSKYGNNLKFFSIKVPAFLIASVASGAVFGAYHLARYGIGEALMYVFVTGTVLSIVTLVAYKKQGELRLGPAIVAHSLNNGSSYLLAMLGGLL